MNATDTITETINFHALMSGQAEEVRLLGEEATGAVSVVPEGRRVAAALDSLAARHEANVGLRAFLEDAQVAADLRQIRTPAQDADRLVRVSLSSPGGVFSARQCEVSMWLESDVETGVATVIQATLWTTGSDGDVHRYWITAALAGHALLGALKRRGEGIAIAAGAPSIEVGGYLDYEGDADDTELVALGAAEAWGLIVDALGETPCRTPMRPLGGIGRFPSWDPDQSAAVLVGTHRDGGVEWEDEPAHDWDGSLRDGGVNERRRQAFEDIERRRAEEEYFRTHGIPLWEAELIAEVEAEQAQVDQAEAGSQA